MNPTEGNWQFRQATIQRRNRRLRRILIVLLILAVICAGIVWWVGTGVIAPANRDIGRPPSEVPFTSHSLPSKSGSNLAAWYAAADNANTTVILLHPLRGSRNSMISRAVFLYKAGYSVMLVDLQAHGESLNDNVTYGKLEKLDVRAVVDDVRAKNPDHKIVIIGSSLGGAAAILGSPLDVDAMVLESVYPTAEKDIHNRVTKRLRPLGMGRLGNLAGSLLTWQFKPRLGVDLNDLRPVDKIGEISCPVLILAGELDQKNTIEDSQEMFDAAKSPKQMEVFAKAKHQDFHRFAPELYEEKVLAFLNEHVSSKSNDVESN